MSSARPFLVLPVLACLFLTAPSLAQSLDKDVRLEGSGRHREECDAKQYKPFDVSLFANLTKWSGAAPAPEAIKGKVLLLVTWTSYAKSANSPAIELADRMSKQYADKGLIVAAIHNPKGFDAAKSIAEELKLSIPYAADEAGKARAILNADADPDFFVIDRAGNMRFCDVETPSVERAVELALGETPEQAAAVPANLAKSAADQVREASMAREMKGVVKPGSPLTVAYIPPPEDTYPRANWPTIITKTSISEYDTLAEKINTDKPQLALNDEGWAGTRPVITGRVQLVYSYDPLDTEIAEVPGKMSRLQTAHARDLVVEAAMLKSAVNTQVPEDERKRREEKRAEQARRYVRDNDLNHPLNTLPFQIDNQDLERIVIPIDSRRHASLAFLVATDGHCRWVGNPYWEGFDTVVREFIEADPGVKARRRAEDAQARSAAR